MFEGVMSQQQLRWIGVTSPRGQLTPAIKLDSLRYSLAPAFSERREKQQRSQGVQRGRKKTTGKKGGNEARKTTGKRGGKIVASEMDDEVGRYWRYENVAEASAAAAGWTYSKRNRITTGRVRSWEELANDWAYAAEKAKTIKAAQQIKFFERKVANWTVSLAETAKSTAALMQLTADIAGPDEAPVRIEAAEAWNVAVDSIERAISEGWTPVVVKAAAGAANATAQVVAKDSKISANAWVLAAAAWDTAAKSFENNADVAVDLASNVQTSSDIIVVFGTGSIGLFVFSGAILAVFRFRLSVSNTPFLVA